VYCASSYNEYIMKTFLKTFIFSGISIYLTSVIIDAFNFDGETNMTFFAVLLALTFVNVFGSMVLKLLSLPTSGPGYVFLSFVLNLVVLYILTLFIPSFYVEEANVTELIIFGVVLPSKSLTKTWALVFSALLFTLILNFFGWLCRGRK
jgi:hypothetical protein